LNTCQEIFAHHGTKEFQIKIQIKAMCQLTRQSMKAAKGRNETVREKVLEEKCPIVACVSVNQDNCVSELTNQDTVTKCNIHMDSIKIAIFGLIKSATSFCLWGSGI
jgi:hypothetical protein